MNFSSPTLYAAIGIWKQNHFQKLWVIKKICSWPQTFRHAICLRYSFNTCTTLQLIQDAVGRQFHTVYNETVTRDCSVKVRNMAMRSKCVKIDNLITCTILLQLVTLTGKIKCLLLRSCDTREHALPWRSCFFRPRSQCSEGVHTVTISVTYCPLI